MAEGIVAYMLPAIWLVLFSGMVTRGSNLGMLLSLMLFMNRISLQNRLNMRKLTKKEYRILDYKRLLTFHNYCLFQVIPFLACTWMHVTSA